MQQYRVKKKPISFLAHRGQKNHAYTITLSTNEWT